jgi:hypothetical protein
MVPTAIPAFAPGFKLSAFAISLAGEFCGAGLVDDALVLVGLICVCTEDDQPPGRHLSRFRLV